MQQWTLKFRWKPHFDAALTIETLRDEATSPPSLWEAASHKMVRPVRIHPCQTILVTKRGLLQRYSMTVPMRFLFRGNVPRVKASVIGVQIYNFKPHGEVPT